MACVSPITGYQRASGGRLVFGREPADCIAVHYLGCNKCVLCRVSLARDLATRLVCESFSHDRTSVATLTFSDEAMPPLGSVSKRHFQLFMKRLRAAVARRGGSPIRFHGISEYSPELLRPHIHCCLFGYWPIGAEPWAKSGAGNQEYVSDELSKAWSHGRVTFQPFSPAAAGYVSRHQAFKLTDELGRQQLAVHDEDGALLGYRDPPFDMRSLKPGLGAAFFEKHQVQLLAHDFLVVVDGKRCPLPKYFDRLAERVDPGRLSELKAARALAASLTAGENLPERLEARETVAKAKLSLKRRNGVK